MRAICALLVLGLVGSSGVSQALDPDTLTADHLVREAEVKAASQNKNVLLMFSASWCGPCHLLQSYLADPLIRPIFDRNFVQVVLIHGERPSDTRHQDTAGAGELLNSLHDTDTSIPLMVILSSSGRLIVDSVRPVYGPRNIQANIGFPEGPTGTEWFLEMLRRAAPSLTSNDIDTISNGLLRHSKHGS